MPRRAAESSRVVLCKKMWLGFRSVWRGHLSREVRWGQNHCSNRKCRPPPTSSRRRSPPCRAPRRLPPADPRSGFFIVSPHARMRPLEQRVRPSRVSARSPRPRVSATPCGAAPLSPPPVTFVPRLPAGSSDRRAHPRGACPLAPGQRGFRNRALLHGAHEARCHGAHKRRDGAAQGAHEPGSPPTRLDLELCGGTAERPADASDVDGAHPTLTLLATRAHRRGRQINRRAARGRVSSL